MYNALSYYVTSFKIRCHMVCHISFFSSVFLIILLRHMSYCAISFRTRCHRACHISFRGFPSHYSIICFVSFTVLIISLRHLSYCAISFKITCRNLHFRFAFARLIIWLFYYIIQDQIPYGVPYFSFLWFLLHFQSFYCFRCYTIPYHLISFAICHATILLLLSFAFLIVSLPFQLTLPQSWRPQIAHLHI